jgi:hypothetical protein
VGPSCQLRFARICARLKFQDGPSVAKLRRLKDVAAYNIAQHLICHRDIMDLHVPIYLRKLVKPFIITISRGYMFDLNENCNKRIVKYCKYLHPVDPVVRLTI